MTTFSFNSVQLETFGHVTRIDDYLDIPARRGKDQMIPFRHGETFVKKFYDARVMSFGIAVIEASAAALEAQLDTMRQLFAPQAQKYLSMTLEDSSVRRAYASVSKPLNVNKIAPNVARVVVEFELPDPILRSDTAIADNTTTINASPKAMTVTNTGTLEERDPTITLAGPLTNVVITNSTNGLTLTYTGIIANGETVVIWTNAYNEYRALMDGSTNVIGNVTHSGDTALMVFNVGANTLSITSDVATTGTVKAAFYPPYA
jgi:phage-related protein